MVKLADAQQALGKISQAIKGGVAPEDKMMGQLEKAKTGKRTEALSHLNNLLGYLKARNSAFKASVDQLIDPSTLEAIKLVTKIIEEENESQFQKAADAIGITLITAEQLQAREAEAESQENQTTLKEAQLSQLKQGLKEYLAKHGVVEFSGYLHPNLRHLEINAADKIELAATEEANTAASKTSDQELKTATSQAVERTREKHTQKQREHEELARRITTTLDQDLAFDGKGEAPLTATSEEELNAQLKALAIEIVHILAQRQTLGYDVNQQTYYKEITALREQLAKWQIEVTQEELPPLLQVGPETYGMEVNQELIAAQRELA